MNTRKLLSICSVIGVLTLTQFSPVYANTATTNATAQTTHQSRLLPLEGGSNFRDLGGYQTTDHKIVRSGMLFRSGAMANLTAKDEAYLNQHNFKTVVDLRSQEELDLFPNQWVKHNSDINYVNYQYSIKDIQSSLKSKDVQNYGAGNFYLSIADRLQPQLKLYFAELLHKNTPLVVNCSAGQDRTGFASAMLLSALGVPRDVIIEDYLLSTQYRNPKNEMGSVDLKKAAKTNDFAKMMLHYTDNGKATDAKPLITQDGTPYISIAFAQIEKQYGSVENYLERAIGVDQKDIAKLRSLYLQ
ncbi:tyrosine-protein phosphatase [Zhongshania aliphaticivorans]|uniref:tyrosine-protein phosphatase n=1 Tax=Zhongshania aliphaticivorans TaxID=1470434 RepID=UPI0012E5F163|nr:tyrosine-protein phosphatase [Zhongshania aliphaticivorans]CAA0090968.1 Tyrosine-protein phosphatase [Zhongshania aliphaticivorans]